MSYPSRKVRPGAYALDFRGSILHHNPSVIGWGPGLSEMSRDVELLMLGMVEIKVRTEYRSAPGTRMWGETYYPTPYDPYYLFLNWALDRPHF